MTTYDVIVFSKANRDVSTIVDWLLKRSPAGASRWTEAFNSALQRLSADPLQFGEVPERFRFPHKIRQIFFKTRRGKLYRAIFIVVDNEVRVLRVRGPHQRTLRRRDLPEV